MKKRKVRDIAEIAYQTVKEAAQDIKQDVQDLQAIAKQKNPAAVALGRLGGLIGGKVRAEKLSAKRRKEIALRAAKARWKKKT